MFLLLFYPHTNNVIAVAIVAYGYVGRERALQLKSASQDKKYRQQHQYLKSRIIVNHCCHIVHTSRSSVSFGHWLHRQQSD